jgi:GxxExxY protein
LFGLGFGGDAMKNGGGMVDDPLTHRIIGCAMRVHRELGSGFQEVIYQRALAIEMQKQGVSFLREQEMPIYYDNHEIGTRRVDFLAEQRVLIELKALAKMEDVHLAQALNYLEAFNLETGLLINFGAKSLEFKRLINRKRKTRKTVKNWHPTNQTQPKPTNIRD